MLMLLTCEVIASALVLSQDANSAACCGCWESVVTVVAEPPQMPVDCAPSVHRGSGATAHLPLVSGAMPPIWAGAQAPEIQVASAPVFICLFHCGENEGPVAMSPACTRFCQYSATCLDGASLMPTCQVLPVEVHQLAPACWARPENQPGSAASKLVRYTPGAFWCSVAASLANCDQVVGTARP